LFSAAYAVENSQILGAVRVRGKFFETMELCGRKQQIPRRKGGASGGQHQRVWLGKRGFFAEESEKSGAKLRGNTTAEAAYAPPPKLGGLFSACQEARE
jgi:hypothetical protein